MATDKQSNLEKGGKIMAEPERDAQIQYSKWLKDDTIKVKLERGQRGSYAWEISYEGTNEAEVLKRIASMDSKLREQYQGGE